MKKQKLLMFFCVSVVFFSMVSGVQNVIAKQIVLKLGHINAPGATIDKQAQKFKQLVEDKSKGQVRIDVYPASQLGKIREIIEGISMGTVEMTLEGLGMFARLDKELNFYSAPFMFRNAQEYLKDNYRKKLTEDIRKRNGIRMLCQNGIRPPMHLFTKNRPIKSLEDLKGLKLRMPPVKSWVDVWNGLGAIAVAVPWSEVYMALSQNVVDGMVHNFLQIRNEKFYEHLKYATLLDFYHVVNGLWINDSKYRSFSPELQNAFEESAIESGEFFTNWAVSENKEARKQGNNPTQWLSPAPQRKIPVSLNGSKTYH